MNLISGYQSIIIVFKSVYYELEYDTTDAVLSCTLGTDCKNNYSSFRSAPPVKDIDHTV